MQVVIPDFDELENTGIELNDPLPAPLPPPPASQAAAASPRSLPARLASNSADDVPSTGASQPSAPPLPPHPTSSASPFGGSGAPWPSASSAAATTSGFRGADLWHGRSGSNASSENNFAAALASAPTTTSSFPFRLPNNSGGLSLSGKDRDRDTPKEKGSKKGSLASLRAALKSATSSSNPLALVSSQSTLALSASHEPLPAVGASGSAPSFRPSFSSTRSYEKSAAQSLRHHHPASISTRTHQRTGSLVSVAHGTASDSDGYVMDLRNYGHLHKRSQLSGSSIAGSSFDGNFPGAPPVPPFPLHLQGDAFKTINSSDSSLEVLKNITSRPSISGGARTYHNGTGQSGGSAPFTGETALSRGVGIPDAQTPLHYALNTLLAEFVDLARFRAAYLISDQGDASSRPGQSRTKTTTVEQAFERVCKSLGSAAVTDLPLVWSLLFTWRSVQNGTRPSDSTPINSNSTTTLAAGDGDDFTISSGFNSAPPTPSKVQLVSNQAHVRRAQLISLINLVDVLTIVLDSASQQADSSIDPVQNLLSFLRESLVLRNTSERLFARAQASLGQFAAAISTVYRTRLTETILSLAQKSLAANPTEKPDAETDLQIRLLSKMRIITFPMETFEDCAEAILSVAKMFVSARGRSKNTFAETLATLLLQVAKNATVELHHPSWVEVTETIWPKALSMIAKPRYWTSGFLLGTAILCASKEDVFLHDWWAYLETSFPHLKDRSQRTLIAECASRLLWVYLFRCKESSNATARRLEAFFRVWFPGSRRSLEMPDTGTEFHALMLHFVLYRHFDLGSDFILDLLRATALQSNTLTKQPEVINKPRMVAAIRAVSMTWTSFQAKESPPFPETFPLDPALVRLLATGNPDGTASAMEFPTSNIETTQKKFDDLVGKIAILCDQQVGEISVFDRTLLSAGSGAHNAALNANEYSTVDSEREGLVWRFHPDMRATAAYPHVHQPYMDVLRACINIWPHCLTTKVQRNMAFSILFRALMSPDWALALAAENALQRFAARPDMSMDLLSYVGRNLMRPELHRVESGSGNLQEFLLRKTIHLFDLWAICFDKWQEHLRAEQVAVAAAGSNGEADSTGAASEPPPKTMSRAGNWATLDEVESYSVILMALPAVALRRIAAKVSEHAYQVEKLLLGEGRRGSEMGQPPLTQASRVWQLLLSPIETALDGDLLARLNAHLRTSDVTLSEVLQARESVNGVSWRSVQACFFRQCGRLFPTIMALVKSNLASRFTMLESYLSASPFSSQSTSLSRLSPSNSEFIVQTWSSIACCLAAVSTTPGTSSNTPGGHKRQVSDPGTETSTVTGSELVKELLAHAINGPHEVSEGAAYAVGGINRHLFYVTLKELHLIMADVSADDRKPTSAPSSTSGHLHHRRDVSVRARGNQGRKATSLILSSIIPYCQILDDPHRSEETYLILSWIKEMLVYLKSPKIKDDVAHNSVRVAFATVVAYFVDSIVAEGTVMRFFSIETINELFTLCLEWQSFDPTGENGKGKLAELLTMAAFRQKDEQVRLRVVNDLRAGIQELAHQAAKCLASLCSCVPILLPEREDPTPTLSGKRNPVSWVLTWAQKLLISPTPMAREPAHRAFKNILAKHKASETVWRGVVDLVYDEPVDAPFVNSVFYELVQQKDGIPEQVLERHLYILLLFKMTDDDSGSRLAAFDWLRSLGQNVAYSRAWLRQGTSSVHVHAVQHVCRGMSGQLKAVRCWVLAECGARVEQLQVRRHTRAVISAILGAALEGIKLSYSPEHGYSAETYIILSNLLWITVQLEEAVEEHLQDCIAALCGEGDRVVPNIQVLLRFLLDCNQHVQHQRMLDATHRLVAFVHRLHPDIFWTEACAALTPNSAISLTVKPFVHDQDAQFDGAFVPDLRNLLSYGREEDNPISAAALLLTFLALCGVGPDVNDEYRALVLHVSALSITSLWPPAQDAATSLLEDILEDQPASVRASVPADVLELITLPSAPPAPTASGSPSISAESEGSVALLTEWRRVALLWSTSVPVRAFACQSFVIFRQLKPPAEATSLAEILGRLSSSISDGSDDVSLFSIEALRTIHAMTQQLVLSDDSVSHTDFAVPCLWTCLASMTSINETECAEAFSLLSVLLSKMAHLQGHSFVDTILAQQPPDWDQGSPDWTLSILLSLHCTTTRRAAMGLTQRLLEMDSLANLYDEDRFLGLCFIAMLPYFVLSLEPGRSDWSEEENVTVNIAGALATRFGAKGLMDLQRTCEAVANARFKIIDDLIRQGVNGARVHYVPHLMEPAVFLLFGSALTPDPDARAAALKVAKAFVETLGPVHTPLLAELSSDIWIPLLLALTPGDDASVQDALSCLNLTTRVQGGPSARQLFRMSNGMQARTGASTGQHGTSDDTPANRFFGPVSPTGWSVADAHEATVRTRSNLANTFRRCEQNLDIVPAAVHVNFVEAGDISDGSLWNASESRTRETTPGPGGPAQSQEDELEGIVAQLHDLSNFFVAGALPPQQLAPPSSYQGLSRNSSVHLSRNNTQNGRDPQKQVAKVLSRAAAYSGPALPHSRAGETQNVPATGSDTPIQDYVAANDSFALAMATGGGQESLPLAQ